MMKQLIAIASVVTTLIFNSTSTLACTGIVVGKKATEDGNLIIGRTEDIGSAYNKNFVVVERTTYKKGECFEDLNGFKIEQPKNAYKYTMTPDVDAHEDGIYGEAGMNEKGVAMSATVSASVNEKVKAADPFIESGIREAAILSVVLPRITSAQEGVEVLGEIVETYGAAEGNIVLFADQEEAWYMEILSGHQWAAVKVPDDSYAVIPNCYLLGYIDLEDHDNVKASKELISLPIEKGFLQQKDGKFHLALTYGETLAEGNRLRAWGGQHFFSASQNIPYESETFELFMKADETISLEDVMELQRYRYEETAYDVNLPENADKRAIGTERQAECHIFQMKPNYPKEVGGVMWLAMGNAEHSVYLPSFNGLTKTPAAYSVQGINYNPASAYWNFRSLATLAEIDRSNYGEGVRAYWKAYEKQLIENQVQWEKTFLTTYEKNQKKGESYATLLFDEVSGDALEKAQLMHSELLTFMAKNAGRTIKTPFKPSL